MDESCKGDGGSAQTLYRSLDSCLLTWQNPATEVLDLPIWKRTEGGEWRSQTEEDVDRATARVVVELTTRKKRETSEKMSVRAWSTLFGCESVSEEDEASFECSSRISLSLVTAGESDPDRQFDAFRARTLHRGPLTLLEYRVVD